MTFMEIVAAGRVHSALQAWTRARIASRLRHLAVSQRRFKAAKILGEVKDQGIKRALELVPAEMRVGEDRDYLIGRKSVRWYGHGALHLREYIRRTRYVSQRREYQAAGEGSSRVLRQGQGNKGIWEGDEAMMYNVQVGSQVFKFHGSASEAGEYAKRKAAALRIPLEKVVVKIAR